MEIIKVTKRDETYMTIQCDKGLSMELSAFFCFEDPTYKFANAYKKKHWDGNIRLFNRKGNKLYVGLLPYLKEFAKLRGYKLDIDKALLQTNKINKDDLHKFLDSLDLRTGDKKIIPKDYQFNAILDCLKHKRRTILSPTGSGKSLVAYSLVRLRDNIAKKKKTLIIVPTTALVEQMYNDFKDYSSHNGWDVESKCHRIYSGYEKMSDKDIYISTWQSIVDLPKNYFHMFDTVINDEVHLAEAKSIRSIMEKCIYANFRIGLTGTLKDAKTHKLTIEGLFGKAFRVATTKQLIDRGDLSKIDIHILLLKHQQEKIDKLNTIKNSIEKNTLKYQAEREFICQDTERNLFLKNLCLKLKGNTLILFELVEKHGFELRRLIERDALEGRKIFFVYQGTAAKQRDEIRDIVNKEKDAIIVASYGTFSTGVNIKAIDNIVLSSPSKSKVRVLQSIGRGLRLFKGKEFLFLFDIIDSLKFDDKDNYALNHGKERMKLYDREQHDYKITEIKL